MKAGERLRVGGWVAVPFTNSFNEQDWRLAKLRDVGIEWVQVIRKEGRNYLFETYSRKELRLVKWSKEGERNVWSFEDEAETCPACGHVRSPTSAP